MRRWKRIGLSIVSDRLSPGIQNWSCLEIGDTAPIISAGERPRDVSPIPPVPIKPSISSSPQTDKSGMAEKLPARELDKRDLRNREAKSKTKRTPDLTGRWRKRSVRRKKKDKIFSVESEDDDGDEITNPKPVTGITVPSKQSLNVHPPHPDLPLHHAKDFTHSNKPIHPNLSSLPLVNINEEKVKVKLFPVDRDHGPVFYDFKVSQDKVSCLFCIRWVLTIFVGTSGT